MLLSRQDMVSDQNSDLQKTWDFRRKSAKIIGIPGFAAKTTGSLRNSFENKMKTVGITPIMLEHASWHVIRQSGRTEPRKSMDSRVGELHRQLIQLVAAGSFETIHPFQAGGGGSRASQAKRSEHPNWSKQCLVDLGTSSGLKAGSGSSVGTEPWPGPGPLEVK